MRKFIKMDKTKNKTANFEKMCRTCLREEPMMKELFCKSEESPSVREMIMSCTNVTIEENDGLPDKLCQSCSVQIPKLFLFKSQCESADDHLKYLLKSMHSKYEKICEINTKCEDKSKQYLTNSNQNCVNNVTNNMKLEHFIDNKNISQIEHSKANEMEVEDEILPSIIKRKKSVSICVFGCRKCDCYFLSWNELEKHNSIHVESQLSSNLLCKYCKKTFLNQRNLKSHMIQMHSELKQFECGYCGEHWKDVQNLKMHLIKHHSLDDVDCKIPEKLEHYDHSIIDNSMNRKDNKEFLSVDDVQELLFKEKKSDLNLESMKVKCVCSICGKNFRTWTYLKRHEMTHDPDKPFHCKFGRCPWSFGSEHELSVHVNVNHSTDGDSHECNFCHKEFKHANYLRQHMATHKLIKRFKCKHCHKGFNYLHILKNHERTHTGDLSFLCQECGRAFATNDRLSDHMKRHSDERPFACQLCIKKFISNRELNAHKQRVHTNECPFMCSICGKTFKTRNYLTKHAKTLHSNMLENSNTIFSENLKNQILSCDICKFHAETRQELDKHMKNHTCQYFCPYCPKSFLLASALDFHIKMHSDEDRSHVCGVCKIAFKRADHLRSHTIRKHSTSSKQFKCSGCIRSFSSISDMKKHSRIHESHKPYSCKECGRSFRQSGALRIHSRIHTNERPYICGVCHCSHRTAGCLTSHMRTHTTTMTTSALLDNDENNSLAQERVSSLISSSSQNIDIENEKYIIKLEENNGALVEIEKKEIDPMNIEIFNEFQNLLSDNLREIQQICETKTNDSTKNEEMNTETSKISL